MLQGKKKVLAAQVALGLMLAGQSQLLDCSQAYAAEHLAIIGSDDQKAGAEAAGADTLKVDSSWYISDSPLVGASATYAGGEFAGFAGSTVSLGIGGANLTIFNGAAIGKTVNIGNIGDAQAYAGITLASDVINSANNTINIHNVLGKINQTASYAKIQEADGTYRISNTGASGADDDGGGAATVIKGGASDVMNIYNAGGNSTLKGARATKFESGIVNVLGADMDLGAVVANGGTVNVLGDNLVVGNRYWVDSGTCYADNNGYIKAKNVNISGTNTNVTNLEADTLTTNGKGTLTAYGDAYSASQGYIKVDKVKINSEIEGVIVSADRGLQDKDDNQLTTDRIEGAVVTTSIAFNSYNNPTLSADGKQIVTHMSRIDKIRPQTKSLVETQVASLTQVMGSAELLASSGYVNASQAVKEAKAEGESASVMVPYAAVGYGNIKQNSGSYVNTKNFNANIGFAKEVENKNGKLLFGPMLEYGRGNYDSHLDDGTAGNGTAQNYGLGFMARQDNNNGTYYEGSIRFGKTTSTYDSSNLWVGHNVHYDNSANYWGIHAGVGKIQKLNDKNSIDYYAKLFHTNVGGSSVTVDGSSVDFSSSKSTRTLVGARFTHKTSDVRSIYAGLAWQQEYAGDAHATISGFETPSPSIKGASAMAELGVLVAPSQSPVSFDLGVKGWAGKQQGYSFNAKMNWKF